MSLSAKFEDLPREINETRIKEVIECFRDEDYVKSGQYFIYPYWNKTDKFDWGICYVRDLPTEHVPDSIVDICKKYVFDYNRSSFFSSSDEQRQEEADKLATRSEEQGDSDRWDFYIKKRDALDRKEHESEEQEKMIIDKAKKIWTELLKKDLLQLYLNI